MAQSAPSSSVSLYPKIAESPNSFSHIYISLVGCIKIHGDTIPTIQEIYKLISAEANNEELCVLYKDILDIVMWAAHLNPRGCIHTHGESSIFFGTDALVTKVVPPNKIFILSKRESFKYEVVDPIIKCEKPWTLSGKDWMVEIDLKGHAKRLEKGESEHYANDSKHLYIKSDKYNPYMMN